MTTSKVRRWERNLQDGVSVSLSRKRTSSDNVPGDYEVFCLSVPNREDESVRLVTSGDGRAVRIESSASAKDAICIEVAVPTEVTVERFVLKHGEQLKPIHVPSSAFLEACDEVRSGNTKQADTILSVFETAVQAPMICGTFLGIEELVEFIAGLTSANHHAASQIHSYRYAIVRWAVTPCECARVTTFDEFVRLIDGLNDIDQIGDVDVIDALGDTSSSLPPCEWVRAVRTWLPRTPDRGSASFSPVFRGTAR